MKKILWIISILALGIISLFIGVKNLTLMDILNFEEVQVQIMLISRLPRLVSIIIAGVSMSISGLIMQQISRNKFVSPTTAATVDSSKMGILVAMVLFSGASSLTKMLIAFMFAISGTVLFMKLLGRIKAKSSIFIPLMGMMLGGIIDSLTTFFAYRFDMVQNINSWLMGDFSMVIKGRYELLYISIPLLIITYFYANRFTVAGMGEDFATNLGLNHRIIMNIGIGIVALSTALVVVTVGRIPFLGLIIPNIITMYKGDNMKNNLFITASFGATFLLLADIFGRLIIYPYEISISLTVGVVGSIIFLFLLLRGDN